MKVIAKTDESTYLCEVSEGEMAIIAGYGSEYDSQWQSRAESYKRIHRSLIGLKIDPVALRRFHSTVEANEKKATDCAAVLHALAEMITRSLPTIVITPKAEVAAPVTADSAS